MKLVERVLYSAVVCLVLASFLFVTVACSNKNSNNDVDPQESATGRTGEANWAHAEAKWTRIDPWDGSCPEVKFSTDADGNFKSEGCGGEVVGVLTRFEINRLNETANEVVPMLNNSSTCDLQKTPDLKVEQKLTTIEGETYKFLYTDKSGKTCRDGEIPAVTSLARVLLELQLKYEPGLPRPEPTPTPVPTPTPPPEPLPPAPIPLPTATPVPPATPTPPTIPWPF